MLDRTVMRWESRGGAHWLVLFHDADGMGYHYKAVGALGSLGALANDADAIALIERNMGWGDATRFVDIHQPDANKTPMRRVTV